MNKLSPIVSEFETEEEAAAYDRWFRARVEASLADPRPPVPHDEAMARIRKHLEEFREEFRTKSAETDLAGDRPRRS